MPTLTAEQIGQPCFKVRVVIQGAGVVHVLSATEPKVAANATGIESVEWSPIESEHGDSVGFIRWADVSAVTWRKA